jgi:hypothetical protein
MRRGDFGPAWQISAAVMKERAGRSCWNLPRHQQYVWNGSSVIGKRVLVRCYHGLGDTVQFIRYAPLLKAYAREVIVWAQPVLIPLLAKVAGIDRLLPLHDGVPEAEYDVDVEIMELPFVFRTTRETIPHRVPYFEVTPQRPRATSPPRFNVGLVWRAGDWNPQRSVPVELLLPLRKFDGAKFWVLQGGEARFEWPREDCVSSGDEIEETARLMRAMDLVITIDSLPAHLSGALGVPTWTLLSANPDWRWMNTGETSPWYPTMRLFRQRVAGDWEPVVARVATALEAKTKARSAL